MRSRDLEGLEMIADFASSASTRDLLELYLLPFCDLSSVAPDNLTNWKETLLRESTTHLDRLRGRDLLGRSRPRSSRRQNGRRAPTR